MGRQNDKPEQALEHDAPVSDDDPTRERDTLPTVMDLSRTLPTGAAFQATWKLPAWRPSAAAGTDATGQSGVRKLDLAQTVAKAVSEQADAHEAMRARLATLPSIGPGAAAPDDPSTPSDAGLRASLRRTLRMDLGLPVMPSATSSVGPRNTPRDTLEPQLPSAPPPRNVVATRSSADGAVLATAVQQIGADGLHDDAQDRTRPSGTRTTDPFGQLAPQRERTQTEVDASGADPLPSSSATPTAAAAAAPERTHPRDERVTWTPAAMRGRGRQLAAAGLVLGAIVGAGVMMYVDLDAFDDTGDESDEALGANQHLVTPAGVAPAATHASSEPAHVVEGAVPANATQIVSLPAGAELVLGGAIIANTPAQLPRPSYEIDYLVRLPGYESQLVRLGPGSPATILVNLKAAAAAPENPH
ncbi:MAG TPA: hypothetical protein VF331_14505 [Polyangiales bacterium]